MRLGGGEDRDKYVYRSAAIYLLITKGFSRVMEGEVTATYEQPTIHPEELGRGMDEREEHAWMHASIHNVYSTVQSEVPGLALEKGRERKKERKKG